MRKLRKQSNMFPFIKYGAKLNFCDYSVPTFSKDARGFWAKNKCQQTFCDRGVKLWYCHITEQPIILQFYDILNTNL